MNKKEQEHAHFETVFQEADRILLRFMLAFIVISLLAGAYFDKFIAGFFGTLFFGGVYLYSYVLEKRRGWKNFFNFMALALMVFLLFYLTGGMTVVNFVYFIIIMMVSIYMDPLLIKVGSITALTHNFIGMAAIYFAWPLAKAYYDLFFPAHSTVLTLAFTNFIVAAAWIVALSLIRLLKNQTMRDLRNKIRRQQENQQLKRNEQFAREIAQGNFDFDLETDTADRLGSALSEMRESLKEADRREANERFISNGITKVNETLRNADHDSESLGSAILECLVDYLDAVQGAIFVVKEQEDESVKLESLSLYAYDTRKLYHRSIEPGEGLIGQCYLEMDSIYLLDIPEGYVNINSGLGESEPKALLLTPLIFNDEIAGVLELAFFEPVAEHQRDFIDQSSSNIASSLLNNLRNDRFRRMFEEAQQNNEKMKSQEEELRQNMEELMSTQEELERRSHAQLEKLDSEKKRHEKDVKFYKGEIEQKEQEIQMLRGYIEQLQQD